MYVFLYVYVYPNENSHRHTRQTSSDTRIQTDVGYECRLQGGGVTGSPGAAPLADIRSPCV